MSEVEKLEQRIEAVKSNVDVMNRQLDRLSKKIRKECLIENSNLIDKLYEMKEKAEKENNRSKSQLRALEEQIPIAVKADAQLEMSGVEKELQELLGEHNRFNEELLVKMRDVIECVNKGLIPENKSQLLFMHASSLYEKGAIMKKSFYFNPPSKELIESIGVIRNKLRHAESLRNSRQMSARS